MPTEIQPEYATIDDVPEPVRESFVAGPDGKFRLGKALTVETLPEVAGLKRTLDKYKNSSATFETQASEVRAQMDALKTELEELKAGGGSKKDKDAVQAQIDALKQGHNIELEKERTKTSQLTQRIQTLMRSTATESALTASGTNSPVALRPHVEAALRVVQQGGKDVIIVVDVNSPTEEQLYNTKTGNPLTPAEYAKSLAEKPEFKSLFPGTQVNGADAKGSRVGMPGGFGKVQVTSDQLKDAGFYAELKKIAAERKVHVTDVYEQTDK